jgi:hypothetical protein
VWEPKTDRVSYDGKDKGGKPVKLTYLRSQAGSWTGKKPCTAEDPFDFAQGRLFAKLRTGSEDAEHISWITSGRRDYRNGLGYM